MERNDEPENSEDDNRTDICYDEEMNEYDEDDEDKRDRQEEDEKDDNEESDNEEQDDCANKDNEEDEKDDEEEEDDNSDSSDEMTDEQLNKELVSIMIKSTCIYIPAYLFGKGDEFEMDKELQ